MARIRTIKPELFLSETLAQVSLAAERTFTGLLTQADDRGRLRYNAAVLNGALWPLRPEHTPDDLASEIVELVEVGALCQYDVDGKPYLHFPTWTDHQKISHPSTRVNGPECPKCDLGEAATARPKAHKAAVPADPYEGITDSSDEKYGKFPEPSGDFLEPSGNFPNGKGKGKGSGKGMGKGTGREKAPLAAPAPDAEKASDPKPQPVPRGTKAKSAATGGGATADRIVSEFSTFTHGMVNTTKIKAVVKKGLDGGYGEDAILTALQSAHRDGKPLTAEVLHQYLEGYARAGGRRRNEIHYAADRPTTAADYSEDL